MAKYSTYYRIPEPEASDRIDPVVFQTAFDTIDEAIHDLSVSNENKQPAATAVNMSNIGGQTVWLAKHSNKAWTLAAQVVTVQKYCGTYTTNQAKIDIDITGATASGYKYVPVGVVGYDFYKVLPSSINIIDANTKLQIYLTQDSSGQMARYTYSVDVLYFAISTI